ncbi:MAG: ZIP Zinc transporter family protein [Berkelbacteria bacterium GW2011_GWA1_36_9]|uniref:ZIP Zinc transporter family protein n=1 Tax=Berkelbacteria bacterium GW2011_GWA1_36_9 TaxID=1618331 RepID=A0A0G0ILW9_9BACT|nr:MAG: ZIP Zinc transporter family protein [Berkelbacteria bacterium GW2011_GWA1_36_9]
MALVVALATIISTFLGGLFAIRFKDKLHLILGFSAGAVIGVALFDLLPESINLTSNTHDLNFIMLLIAIGFIFYLLVDRLFSLHANEEKLHTEENCENSSHSGKFGAFTLAVHSFLDGFGIGLAFKISPAIGWTVAVAVLTHGFSDGINTVNMILKNKGGQKQALKWLIIDALAPALGVLSTLFFAISESTLGLILAVFTGLFLYLGASDLIPESHHHHPTIWTTVMTILGIVVLYSVIHFAT